MSQLYCTGRVVSELELKASVKGIPYVCFPVAERVGYGKTAHTQYLSVWAWGAMARQLADSVGRGSVLWVSGSLDTIWATNICVWIIAIFPWKCQFSFSERLSTVDTFHIRFSPLPYLHVLNLVHKERILHRTVLYQHFSFVVLLLEVIRSFPSCICENLPKFWLQNTVRP